MEIEKARIITIFFLCIVFIGGLLVIVKAIFQTFYFKRKKLFKLLAKNYNLALETNFNDPFFLRQASARGLHKLTGMYNGRSVNIADVVIKQRNFFGFKLKLDSKVSQFLDKYTRYSKGGLLDITSLLKLMISFTIHSL